MHVPVTVTDYSLSSFYKGVYAVVDDSSLDAVVSWSKNKKSFIIWDPIEFQRRVLPTGRERRIRSLNFSMFMADLKYYVSFWILTLIINAHLIMCSFFFLVLGIYKG